ncbi:MULTISPECIES: H-NS histone family protein [Burkholderiaceae]|uniref:Histone protein n=1 Tax=Caballeronia sordidicola TaxID=196367 RepID=A0A242MN82_CABSO|nr:MULTISPECIES: H-NS histone family protein [Burkholderiaceae]OTP72713.1 histone protein [Caballeronia sordidicola]
MPTIEQLRVKITKLQVQADALIAKKMQAAVDQIRNIMLEHGLTTEDIEKKAKALRNAKAAKGSAAKTPLKTRRKTARSLPGKGAAKYLHPKTGATWTGHGRAPAWIAQVKDRSKFLIAEGAAAADAKVTQPGAARKNAKAKSSATSGATAKKAAKKAALKPARKAARKAAAKKGVAKKAVALKKTAPAKKAARKRAAEAVAESQTTS